MNVEKANRDFGWAISMLKAGKKVAREIWSDGQWAEILDDKINIVYPPKNFSKYVWQITQSDALAEDWTEVVVLV